MWKVEISASVSCGEGGGAVQAGAMVKVEC